MNLTSTTWTWGSSDVLVGGGRGRLRDTRVRARLLLQSTQPSTNLAMPLSPRSRSRAAAAMVDRDRYVLTSPPLEDDMYGELVPPAIAQLISHLESCGNATEDLFGGDPRVRDINDVLDELRASGGSGVDVDNLTRGDSRLAAASLAAYCRQLPEALVPEPEATHLCAALDVPDFALRIAGIRDLVSTLPEANQAVLHRLCHFLSKLGGYGRHTNPLPKLALFWGSMVFPTSGSTRRERRVREYRLVSLLLQHCACIFEGSLEAVELPELPLPAHLAAEEAEAQAASKQWVRIKASLLRDTAGQFRISLLEDAGGIYFNKIEPTDVCDDRERLEHRDYLVSISRKSVDDMSLAAVEHGATHTRDAQIPAHSPHTRAMLRIPVGVPCSVHHRSPRCVVRVRARAGRSRTSSSTRAPSSRWRCAGTHPPRPPSRSGARRRRSASARRRSSGATTSRWPTL